MDRRLLAGLIVGSALVAAVGLGVWRRDRDEGARCGAGFVAQGPRCVVPASPAGTGSCPAPLVMTPRGCDAPDTRVLIPAAAIAMGPSDWEAEGRVTPRTIRVPAFRIDAFEVTRGRLGLDGELARAASDVSLAEAAAFCAASGGRLPTEDEWIVAAASAANPPRRYPWGDTGAVCRRAAWGLQTGPCAQGADGPDTVGAHPDGDSPLGLHDLAGNVAEWVAGGIAKGGSWASSLASDLRIWARVEPEGPAGRPPAGRPPAGPEADAVRDPRIGFRCVYPP